MRRPIPSSDASRIIELFARQQPAYGTVDVLRLLGINEAQLASAISEGAVAPEPNEIGASVIPWEDVAALALEEWTPRMIEAALRTEVSDIIPHLNQHRLIRISLPIYLIRLMDYLARFESATRHVPRNASDLIECVLHDFANTQDTVGIDREVHGYAQALTYPYFMPRRTGVLWLRCRYCGVAISEAVREVCRNCERHHEPNEHLGEYGLPELEEQHETPAHQTQPATTPEDHEPATRGHRRQKRRRAATRSR